MRTNPRVVFDTNVLISAALSPHGASRKAVDWVAEYGIILSSGETAREFTTRIRRSKFDPYVKEEEREAFIDWIVLHTEPIEVDENVQTCRDPDDDKFLELALSGGADVIISGDDDLQVLDPFRGIPILSPDKFLKSEFVTE